MTGATAITLETATSDALDEVCEAVARWQHEGGPVQLHPGDLGWTWRLGSDELAQDLRVWRRASAPVAVGLVDGAGLVRMALAPEVDADEEVAARLRSDLTDPACGVLPAGPASVEARYGTAFRHGLATHGWTTGESWTPLRRDLTAPVEEAGLRVEVLDAHTEGELVAQRVLVQRNAFDRSTFTAQAWRRMAASAPYRQARCLVGVDPDGTAVAAATVWSAGPGRPGLLEPVGVHVHHRGHGYGRAISVAAAAMLRALGASSATVCTPSSNVAAVTTYRSAGFAAMPEVTDFGRPD